MSEDRQLTQEKIDYETENHLRLLLPMLERLGTGSATQIGSGYVEWEGPGHVEEFTPMGWSMVDSAQHTAYDSATYLDDVLGDSRGDQSTTLLSDAQQFLAVAWCTLKGMDRDGAPSGVNPPWVATALLSMAKELLKRVDARKVEELAHV